MDLPRSREMIAEFLGTLLLVTVIVGSGIAATDLTSDRLVAHIGHTIAVGLSLVALIAFLGSVSRAHLNPAVTTASWLAEEIGGPEATRVIAAQSAGGLFGVVIANLMFSEPAFVIATVDRSGPANLVSEFVATFVLVLLILVLVRKGRSDQIPMAVGAWVGTAMIATPSTAFANPAVTLARIFTDSYTGVMPIHAFSFVIVQLLAGVAASFLAHLLTGTE